MAKDTKFDEKKMMKHLDKYSFKRPEKDEDGAIITPKYKTGIFYIDLMLKGGLPQGKVVGLSSEEGGGKTTVLMQACGKVVQYYPGKKAYYLDVEGGATYELYDEEDNPEGPIKLLQVETIQDVGLWINMVSKDPDTALIIVDSTTFTADERDMEDEFLGTGKNAAAKSARMWSGALPAINATIKRSNACLILIHQARTDLSGFHVTTKSSGGRAAKHAASVEIFGKKKLYIGEGNVTEIKGAKVKKEEAIGVMLELATTKNRLGLPFRKYTLPVIFGKGVSNLWAYKDWLFENDQYDPATGEIKPCIITKDKSSWFTVDLPFLQQKVQGEPAVWELVKEHITEIKAFIEEQVNLR